MLPEAPVGLPGRIGPAAWRDWAAGRLLPEAALLAGPGSLCGVAWWGAGEFGEGGAGARVYLNETYAPGLGL